MKLASPTSVPEGVSSSAGISVSTAALVKAASVAFKVSQISGSAAGAAAAVVAASGLHDVRPVAITAPVAPAAPAALRKSRRGIFSSAMCPSQSAGVIARTLAGPQALSPHAHGNFRSDDGLSCASCLIPALL